MQQPHGLEGGERRLLGGFGEHGVARRERRGDLADEDRQGEVPGADAHHRAQGAQVRLFVGKAADLGGVVAAEVDRLADFAHGVGPGLAGFTHDERQERVGVGFERIGRRLEPAGALWWRGFAPAGPGGDLESRLDRRFVGFDRLAKQVGPVGRIAAGQLEGSLAHGSPHERSGRAPDRVLGGDAGREPALGGTIGEVQPQRIAPQRRKEFGRHGDVGVRRAAERPGACHRVGEQRFQRHVGGDAVDETRVGAVFQQAAHEIGQQRLVAAHRGVDAYLAVAFGVPDERFVERLAHAVQALEFVLAGLPALAGQMEDRRERVCVVRGELGVDHVARGEQPLRAGEIGDVGIDLARIDGVAGEPIDLGALDLAVPVGPLDETNHQPALACPSPSHQPVDDERGAFLVCLHDEAEPVPAGELGVGERRIEQVERELESVGFLGVDVEADVVALGEPAQLQQARQQLGEHAVGLGPVIARMQGAQFHRDAVAVDHAAPGVAPADGVDGVLVIGQVARGVFGRHRRFAQHVEGVTEPFLLERPHAIERFLDRAAGDEGFTQQAHGHVQPLAHQRLAAAREQAREGGGKRLFLGKGNELAGDDQAPGGGIDEDRAAAAQMLAPLAAREFVADEGIARGGVRDTQQRLGQAHERHAFAAREAEFGHQRGHPALLALTLAQGLGEFGSQTFDARQEIRRPSGLFDTGRYTIWFRRPGGERDEVAPGVRRRCGGGSEAHGVSQERGCADYKPSGWRH